MDTDEVRYGVVERIASKKVEWTGHVARRDENRWSKRVIQWWPVDKNENRETDDKTVRRYIKSSRVEEGPGQKRMETIGKNLH